MITADEQRVVGDGRVDFAGGVFGREILAAFVVGIKACRVFVVIYGVLAVLQLYTLTGKSDDTFDDVLFAETRHVLRIPKDYHLATLGHVGLVLQLCQCDWHPVHYQPVSGEQGLFHTWSFDVETSEYEGIDEYGADKHAYDEYHYAKRILDALMSF